MPRSHDDAVILARALKARAEHPHTAPAEAENARRRFREVCKKHHITEAELNLPVTSAQEEWVRRVIDPVTGDIDLDLVEQLIDEHIGDQKVRLIMRGLTLGVRIFDAFKRS